MTFLNFLHDSFPPESIAIISINLDSLFYRLWYFESVFVGFYPVLLRLGGYFVSFIQHVFSPPCKFWILLSSILNRVLHHLYWIQILDIFEFFHVVLSSLHWMQTSHPSVVFYLRFSTTLFYDKLIFL